MKNKALKSDNPLRAQVNKDFIIRLDGWKGTLFEIHSAVGFETAISYCGYDKFVEIVSKAYNKGLDIVRLKANHKLTVTLYRHKLNY